MTQETQNNTPTFITYVAGQNNEKYRVGAIFNHNSGNGFNIVEGQKTYIAFANKYRTAENNQPHFNLFAKDANGDLRKVGSLYDNGDNMNFNIGQKRFTAEKNVPKV